ncbi:MAG: hypothetical protein IMY72_00515 [Bacteroidetes bacterium]|nr:hypothetical protein [Bacteroidota bacterium]
MRMKHYKFLIVLLVFFQTTFAQTKNNYYLLLRNAEKKIVNNQLDSSLVNYNQAFVKYNYPFVRDITAAACVAHFANDTNCLYRYIEILLKRGMSLVELDYFIQKRPNDKKLLVYKDKFTTYQNYYLSSIDKELEKELRYLDKKNQIDLAYVRIHYKTEIDKFKSTQRKKFYDTLVAKYIYLIHQYGILSEKEIGLGSSIFLRWTNDKNNTFHKDIIYEYIDSPDIRENKKDSVFFGYSYIKNRSIYKSYTRPGNSFLWHVNLDNYPNLDSLLKTRLNTLKIYPNFYAACHERSKGGMKASEDYCIAWESATKQKYHFDLKKIIEAPEAEQINKLRASIYIRSLQEDLALFEALQKLENLKYKHYFKLRAKGNSLFFNVLFTRVMP